MFGWFKKKSKEQDISPDNAVDTSHLSPAKQALIEQMREKRAEIGEEELQKMAKAIQMENLEKQIKHDIDHDENKRNRLLDEIRSTLKE
jgi:hypothetical protein